MTSQLPRIICNAAQYYIMSKHGMITKSDIVKEYCIEYWQVKDNVNTQNAEKSQCQSIVLNAGNY